MKEEKKIDFVFDINSHLQNKIKNSRYIKYGTTATMVLSAILILGFASNVAAYAIRNIKVLKQTLKK